MRTSDDIRNSLENRFKNRTGQSIRRGSVIDLINGAISKELSDAYVEIENNKDPHIYTHLSGENLDRMGYFVNVPRATDESDSDYLYRIMNWTYLKAASNKTAITDSLLNMENASDAQYFPGVYGAGTGTVYVIPKSYDEDTITKALQEAKDRLADVIDPAAYTEYIVPTIKGVKLLIQIYSATGDLSYIKSVAQNKIAAYINSIAPKEYFKLSEINKIGLSIDNVDYFNAALTYIDGESKTDIQFLQDIETKYLFDEIIWEDIDADA